MANCGSNSKPTLDDAVNENGGGKCYSRIAHWRHIFKDEFLSNKLKNWVLVSNKEWSKVFDEDGTLVRATSEDECWIDEKHKTKGGHNSYNKDVQYKCPISGKSIRTSLSAYKMIAAWQANIDPDSQEFIDFLGWDVRTESVDEC